MDHLPALLREAITASRFDGDDDEDRQDDDDSDVSEDETGNGDSSSEDDGDEGRRNHIGSYPIVLSDSSSGSDSETEEVPQHHHHHPQNEVPNPYQRSPTLMAAPVAAALFRSLALQMRDAPRSSSSILAKQNLLCHLSQRPSHKTPFGNLCRISIFLASHLPCS